MLRKLWIASESLMGLLATIVIGLIPVGALLPVLVQAVQDRQWLRVVLAAAGFPISLVIAGTVITIASRVVNRKGSIWPNPGGWPAYAPGDRERDDYEIDENPPPAPAVPLAVAMARELRPLPWIISVPLSLWWIAHFGLALLLGHLAARLMAAALIVPGIGLFLVVGAVLHFGFLFAANLYLLLAAAVLRPSETFQHKLWNSRVWIDSLLATASMCLILFSR